MEKKLHIISNTSDKAALDAVSSQLKDRGIEVSAEFPSINRSEWTTAIEAPVAILCLSPDADENIYHIAGERKTRGLSTINLFVKPTELSIKQKEIVGQNHTVFAELCSGAEGGEILDIVDDPKFGMPTLAEEYAELLKNAKGWSPTKVFWMTLLIGAILIIGFHECHYSIGEFGYFVQYTIGAIVSGFFAMKARLWQKTVETTGFGKFMMWLNFIACIICAAVVCINILDC